MNYWSRADDLELINMIYEGLTSEGITERTGYSVSRIANRLRTLGLGFGYCRKAKRNGTTPEALLDASPIYKRDLPLLNRDLVLKEELEMLVNLLETVTAKLKVVAGML